MLSRLMLTCEIMCGCACCKAIEHYGRVDIPINNNVGGAIWMKPFEESFSRRDH